MEHLLHNVAAVLAALLVVSVGAAPRLATAQPAGYTCDGSAGVYLYTGLNHSGRCLRVTGHLADLEAFGFGDEISSLRMDGAWTATLYADQTFGGAASTYTGDDPNLIDDAIGDNRASSIRVWPGVVPVDHLCDGREGVYLFDLPGYGGRCLRFITDSADLGAQGFDNAVASVAFVGEWTATLTVDAGFGGSASTFIANDSNLADNSVASERASSLRLRRGRADPALRCDGGEGVYLYRDTQYRGACRKFTGDVPDLRDAGFNDDASSLRLVGEWEVILYRDLDYTGDSAAVVADTPDLDATAVGNLQATSLQIRRGPVPRGLACDGGPGVYLYQDPQFSGRCMRLTASAPDLRDYRFDDLASAVRVVGDYAAAIYRDPNFTGISAEIRADDPDLADGAVGDNQVTSVRVERR